MPTGNGPSRVGDVRRRGGALGGEINRDGESAPLGSLGKPVYSTPVKPPRRRRAAPPDGARS
jgi:hypothetical protein